MLGIVLEGEKKGFKIQKNIDFQNVVWIRQNEIIAHKLF